VAADSEDLVILAGTVLIQSQSAMDRQTERQTHTVRQTPWRQLKYVKHYVHTVAREKSCHLKFCSLDSLVCIVARSREKSCSLSLIPFLAHYRSLLLTGLV